MVRTLRTRITLHGEKDRDADDMDTFSGTTSSTPYDSEMIWCYCVIAEEGPDGQYRGYIHGPMETCEHCSRSHPICDSCVPVNGEIGPDYEDQAWSTQLSEITEGKWRARPSSHDSQLILVNFIKQLRNISTQGYELDQDKYSLQLQDLQLSTDAEVNTMVQREPKKLLYQWIQCGNLRERQSDTGLHAEPDKEGVIEGRSARGSKYLRMDTDLEGKETCHFIEAKVGMTKVAARSKATTNGATRPALNFQDIRHGPLPHSEVMHLRDESGATMDIAVETNARDTLATEKVLHALMDKHRIIQHERETLKLPALQVTPKRHKPSAINETNNDTSRPVVRGSRTATRAARTKPFAALFAPFAAMAAGSSSSGMMDANSSKNPWDALGLRYLPVEDGMEIGNSGIIKQYRKMVLQLHPDKIKPGDPRSADEVKLQFCNATDAKELLYINENDPVAVERRKVITRRWLWTSVELASRGQSWESVDQSMDGNLSAHVQRLRTQAQQHLMTTKSKESRRVLPGVAVLQGHLAQAYQSRRRGGKGGQHANQTLHKRAGTVAPERCLAIIQHESLLLFRGRPYQTPLGSNTQEARAKARRELHEAIAQLTAETRLQNMLKAQVKRKAECVEKGIPDDSYTRSQLTRAKQQWLRQGLRRIATIQAEAKRRARTNEHQTLLHFKESQSRHVRKCWQQMRTHTKERTQAARPEYKLKKKTANRKIKDRRNAKERKRMTAEDKVQERNIGKAAVPKIAAVTGEAEFRAAGQGDVTSEAEFRAAGQGDTTTELPKKRKRKKHRGKKKKKTTTPTAASDPGEVSDDGTLPALQVAPVGGPPPGMKRKWSDARYQMADATTELPWRTQAASSSSAGMPKEQQQRKTPSYGERKTNADIGTFVDWSTDEDEEQEFLDEVRSNVKGVSSALLCWACQEDDIQKQGTTRLDRCV